MSRKYYNKLYQIFLWTFIVAFVLRFIESFSFLNYSDPLAYHLVGARLWYETSLHQMMKEHDAFLISGLFDYLYIVPTVLFYPNKFLIQIFGQNLHFLFSIGLGSIILLRHFGMNIWGALAALGLLTINRSANFFLAAKNDGALALVVMVAAMLIVEKRFLEKLQGRWRVALIGLLLGLAPAIKLSGLFFIAPIALYYVGINLWGAYKLSERGGYWNSALDIFLASFLALAVFSLILVRNWYYMGAPFFPGLLSHFPGKATQAMIDQYNFYMARPFHWGLALDHLKMLFLGKTYFIILPFLAIYQVFSKKRTRIRGFTSSNIYFYFAIIGYILYALMNGAVLSNRFVYSAYFLFTVFAFKSFREYSIRPWGLIILFLFLLADSKIDKSIKKSFLLFKDYTTKTRREIIRSVEPHTKFWDQIRSERLTKKRLYILSDDFPNMFHAPPNVRLESINLDRDAGFLRDCNEEEVYRLKRYDYAIIHKNIQNDCYKYIREKGKFLIKVSRYSMFTIP